MAGIPLDFAWLSALTRLFHLDQFAGRFDHLAESSFYFIFARAHNSKAIKRVHLCVVRKLRRFGILAEIRLVGQNCRKKRRIKSRPQVGRKFKQRISIVRVGYFSSESRISLVFSWIRPFVFCVVFFTY